MAAKGENNENRLRIDVTRLDPEGETLEGEIDCIDLDEAFVRPFAALRYRLEAQVFGTELLVRGHLEQDFDLVCCRCGKDFDTTVGVDDFTASFEIAEGADEIDVTDEIRESLILALPNYPVCSEACPGVEQRPEPAGVDSRWEALDGLVTQKKKRSK